MNLIYIALYGFIVASAGVFAWWDVTRCENRWRALSIALALPWGAYR